MTLETRVVSDEITPWLADVSAKLGNRAWWLKAMLPAMEGLQRFAVGISPVVTGSYAGSHRVSVSGETVKLSVDPTARNTKTGQLVQRYAGAVEERHQVYTRTWAEAEQAADAALEDMAKDLGL